MKYNCCNPRPHVTNQIVIDLIKNHGLRGKPGRDGSYVQKAYKTYAAMVADKANIPSNTSVVVGNDPDKSKNAYYTYDGEEFTKSDFDPQGILENVDMKLNQAVESVSDYFESNLDDLISDVTYANTEAFNSSISDTKNKWDRILDQSLSNVDKDLADKLIDIDRDVSNTVNDAINSTAVEGGILADTFVTVDNTINQRQLNRGLNSVDELLSIVNPSDGMRVMVNSYHEGLGVGGGEFYYDSSRALENDGGSVLNGFVRSNLKPITPYCFGVKPEVESGADIQKFFDFLGSDELGYSYDITCNTKTGQLLTLEDSVNTAKTVSGYMRLYVVGDLKDNDSPNLIDLKELKDWIFLEGFYINGYSSYTAVKHIINGVMLHNCRRMSLNRIEGRGGEGFLIAMNRETNNNMTTIGRITASNFGLKPRLRPDLTYDFLSSSGATNTGSHRSLIQIDLDAVPTVLLESTLLVISGEPQVVLDYESSSKTATLFPGFLDSHVHDNTASVIHGGGLLAHGKDSGELSYNLLVATNCGIAHCDKALYGCTGNRLTTQNCGAAFVVGNAPASVGGFGTVINQPYTEANTFDFISVSAAGGGTFDSPIALNPNKCRCLSGPAATTGNLTRFIIRGFRNQTPSNGRWISSPAVNDYSWARIVYLNSPIITYLDGGDLLRADRVLFLENAEGTQSYHEGWYSREAVFYRIKRSFKLQCSEGETINGLPEITVEPSEVTDGTFLRALKVGTNWIVKFYHPNKLPVNTITYSDTPPITGTYVKGDITYNTNPTDGDYVGWVCTAGGTPGTWLPFGKIGLEPEPSLLPSYISVYKAEESVNDTLKGIFKVSNASIGAVVNIDTVVLINDTHKNTGQINFEAKYEAVEETVPEPEGDGTTTITVNKWVISKNISFCTGSANILIEPDGSDLLIKARKGSGGASSLVELEGRIFTYNCEFETIEPEEVE